MPVLVPPPVQPLTQPYLTAAQFRAYPTWLDLDNLVPGGAAALQDDVLTDALLAASQWACNPGGGPGGLMRLDAHLVAGENSRTRSGRTGRIFVKPRDIPVRGIVSLSYGAGPDMMTSLGLPAPSMWVEDGREVSFTPGGGLGFTGPPLQFGAAPSPWQQTYVTWSYVAGYPSTAITAPLTGGTSTSATLAGATGVLPGDVLRMYDDVNGSEALTVASTYTPASPVIPPPPTAVPLAAPPANSHPSGTGITGMPRDILQAVIAYTVALLMREDVSQEAPTGFGPAARQAVTGGQRGGAASGLIQDAERWLAPYRPTYR
jgi:hypothetical protein